MFIIKRIIKWTLILFFGTSVLAVLIYRWCPVPFTPLMVIRSVQAVADGESPRWRHTWVPLDSMSRYMPVAVIASEDQNFLNHNGFDYEAIEQAAEEARKASVGAARAPSASKRQRTCFYGLPRRGCAKALRPISPYS